MPYSDILEAKNVWEEMVKTVSNGEIVKEVTEKRCKKTLILIFLLIIHFSSYSQENEFNNFKSLKDGEDLFHCGL